LGLANSDDLETYRSSKQRWEHISKIREHYGYSDITERLVGFRLTRWLYGLCWTGTERPGFPFRNPMVDSRAWTPLARCWANGWQRSKTCSNSEGNSFSPSVTSSKRPMLHVIFYIKFVNLSILINQRVH
jgi:Domain of unknown function (DUF4158)